MKRVVNLGRWLFFYFVIKLVENMKEVTPGITWLLGQGFDSNVYIIESNQEILMIDSGAGKLINQQFQGSSQSDFSSDFEDLVILELGAQAVLGGDQDSSTGSPGTFAMPFIGFP